MEEKNKATQEHVKNQQAIEKVKEELESNISKLRSENDEKVQDLEDRLQIALGNISCKTYLINCIIMLSFSYL